MRPFGGPSPFAYSVRIARSRPGHSNDYPDIMIAKTLAGLLLAMLCTLPAHAAAADEHPWIAIDAKAFKRFQAKDYTGSAALGKQALALATKTVGPRHPDVAALLHTLGLTYAKLQDVGQAEAYYKQAIALRETLPDGDDYKLSVSLNNLAILYADNARGAEAEPLFARVIALEDGRRSVSAHLVYSVEGLARHYFEQGRHAEAETLFLRANDLIEANLFLERRRMGDNLQYLGDLYFAQQHYEKAEESFRSALFWIDKDDTAAAGSWEGVARSQMSRGLHEQAEEPARQALRIREKNQGASHVDVASAHLLLGDALLAQMKHEETESHYRRALDIHQQRLGKTDRWLAIDFTRLARLYRELGQFDQAGEMYRRALAIYDANKAAADLAASTQRFRYGELLFLQGRYDEAETQLRQVWNDNEKAPATDARRQLLSTTLRGIAAVFAATGRAAQADELRQLAAGI